MSNLHPQLGEIKTQLDEASIQAERLVQSVSAGQFIQRPQSDKWSIAECLIHLNLSSKAEIEVIEDVCEKTDAKRDYTDRKFKPDFFGRILIWTLEPPPMFFSKMKTTEPFQPVEIDAPGKILPEFLALQEKLKAQVDAVNGLPLDEIKVVSPFDRRVKYNLLSFFHILLAHERRHLWQAAKVKEAFDD